MRPACRMMPISRSSLTSTAMGSSLPFLHDRFNVAVDVVGRLIGVHAPDEAALLVVGDDGGGLGPVLVEPVEDLGPGVVHALDERRPVLVAHVVDLRLLPPQVVRRPALRARAAL